MIYNILLQVTTVPVSEHKAAEEMGHLDPFGIGMTMISMSVVFFALILLFLVFKYIARLYNMDIRKKILIRRGKVEEAAQLPANLEGDVAAAISMALHLYSSQMHDVENTVLTIKKVSRSYSPWSSKIYGIRHIPR